MATLIEQLDAMRHLPENWDGYGADVINPGAIELAKEFVSLMEVVRLRIGNGDDLFVSPTRVGGVLIDWEGATHQHEIEIDPDGTISFLHLNKATQQAETRKFTPGQRGTVQPGLLQELRQCLAA
jgi:hypothetical protein